MAHPAARQASTILPSSSTSSRTGEHTRYTVSTPSRARPRLGSSAKSAITAPTSADALAASSGERYIALAGLLVLRTSFRTAPPALPEAPVTSIIATSLVLEISSIPGPLCTFGWLCDRGPTLGDLVSFKAPEHEAVKLHRFA